MSAVLEITLPVFAIVGCGLAAARLRMLSEDAVTGLNTFVFWFALPLMLMRAVAGLDLAAFDGRLALAYLAAAVLIYLIVYRVAGGSGMQRTSTALNSTHGNVGYLGLALIAQLAAEVGDPTLLAPAIIIVVVDIAVLIVMSLVLFELHAGRARQRQSQGGPAPSPIQVTARTLLAVLRSPLVLSITAGAVLSYTGWKLPTVADRFVNLMAAAAAPCALFAIGAAFGGRRLEWNRDVTVQILVKLLIYPLTVLMVMRAAGIDPIPAAVATVVASLPAASNGFILARRYGVDTTSLSAATVIGTALAVITVSIAIAALELVG